MRRVKHSSKFGTHYFYNLETVTANVSDKIIWKNTVKNELLDFLKVMGIRAFFDVHTDNVSVNMAVFSLSDRDGVEKLVEAILDLHENLLLIKV